MGTARATSLGDTERLLASFERSLRAMGRSPRTIQSYAEAVRQFAAFRAECGMPGDVAGIRREHVEAWIEHLLARWKPTTAAVRFRSLQQFFRWLREEGEIPDSPMARMRAPALPAEPPAILTDPELRAILRACEGPGYAERRDSAMTAIGARKTRTRYLRVEGRRRLLRARLCLLCASAQRVRRSTPRIACRARETGGTIE